MKKFLLLVLCVFVLSGCKKDNSNVISEMEKKINSLEHYHLIGDLVINSNEDKYDYKVDVTYKKGDYYRVSLINKDNSHEQIILKNEEGVYVVTPSLNKSFKFQSEWPSNSSQTYILECIVNDIKKDEERNIISKEDIYEINSKVNYPNNVDLKTQVIYVDKKTMLPSSLVVKNSNNIVAITMKITDIDLKTKFDNDYFSLPYNIKNSSVSEDKNVSGEIDTIVYPMYLPSGTIYSKEEVVSDEGKERVILTYTGVKPFILIEENASYNKEHQTTNVNGDVVLYNNVLGVMSNSSLNWSENGREYYLFGDELSENELLQIASSTAAAVITK